MNEGRVSASRQVVQDRLNDVSGSQLLRRRDYGRREGAKEEEPMPCGEKKVRMVHRVVVNVVQLRSIPPLPGLFVLAMHDIGDLSRYILCCFLFNNIIFNLCYIQHRAVS
jgi:hypothetical protein